MGYFQIVGKISNNWGGGNEMMRKKRRGIGKLKEIEKDNSSGKIVTKL